MKFLILIIYSYFSSLNSQQFTIGGLKSNTIFIGIENKFDFQSIKGKIVNKIVAPSYINIREHEGNFFLVTPKSNDSFWLKL